MKSVGKFMDSFGAILLAVIWIAPLLAHGRTVPDIGAGGPRCQSTHAVMNKAVVVLVDCNLRTGPTQRSEGWMICRLGEHVELGRGGGRLSQPRRLDRRRRRGPHPDRLAQTPLFGRMD